MLQPRIRKVTLNIGVGAEGERLDKAFSLLQTFSGQKPVKTMTLKRIPTWGIRPKQLVGVKVTLRNERAEDVLKRALEAVARTVKAGSFDRRGNLSFGIKESLDIPGLKYDPKVGVFGLDVCVTIARPGMRARERKAHKGPVAPKHMLTRDEGIAFMKERFNVVVE
jgi:large subunit ribosomal protein L5